MIAGLDVSTKRIGLATTRGELVSITASADHRDSPRRLYELQGALHRAFRVNPPLPELVVLENYSLASPGRLALVRLGEIGGVVRLLLFEMGVRFVEIPPTSVKKFATGRGDADKSEMIARAIDLGARGSVNDDEADAFHLRRMGLAAHGRLDRMDPSYLDGLEDHELDAIANAGVVW